MVDRTYPWYGAVLRGMPAPESFGTWAPGMANDGSMGALIQPMTGADPVGDLRRYNSDVLLNALETAFGGRPKPADPGSAAAVFGPRLAQQQHGLNFVAGMTPMAAAADAGRALNDARAAGQRGDLWGAAGATGLSLLAAIGMVPPGKPFVASRALAKEAKARSLGFRPELAAEIEIIPPLERIKGAAIQGPDRVYGPAAHHGLVLEDMERRLGRELTDAEFSTITDGFLTTTGRFVGRQEALELAQAVRQRLERPRSPFGLLAEDVNLAKGRQPSGPVARTATFPQLERSVAVGTLRRHDSSGSGPAKTLGTDQTSHGAPNTVGRSGSAMPAPTTAVAWPRTNNPAQMDVAGLSPREVAANLSMAWDVGHDAVILKNYTPRGGGAPRDIIVPHNPNQWRLPGARFDRRRLNSRDLTAAIGMPSITFGMLMPQMEERY